MFHWGCNLRDPLTKRFFASQKGKPSPFSSLFAHEPPKDSCHPAPVHGRNDDVIVIGVAGAKSNLSRLNQNMLERAFVIVIGVNRSDLAVLNVLVWAQENPIAGENPVTNHRVTLHSQQKITLPPREKIVFCNNRECVCKSFGQRTGGNLSQEW